MIRIEDYDPLKLYFGDDYKITDELTIHQPTIGEIMEFGEERYYNTVYGMCGIPSDYKSSLWDMGVDYTKLPDFNFFILMTAGITAEDTRLFFGDQIDFSRMELYEDENDSGQIWIQDPITGIVIDELLYAKIIGYIRQMHGIVPKVERAAGPETMAFLIEEDRTNRLQQKKEKRSSVLLPMISGLINNADFKYDIQGLRDIGIYAFMDSVYRINALNTSRAVLNGMYSGMVDMSKNPSLREQIDWLRDLEKEKTTVKNNVTVTSS